MKIYLYLILCLFWTLAAIADTKISELPLGNASTSGTNDPFPYVDLSTSTTKKLKLSDIKNLPSFSTVVQTDRANTYTAGPQSLGTQIQTIRLANDTSTGTTTNKLVKLTTTGTAVITTTVDVSGVIGVAVSGAGTSGNVDIAQVGQTSCVFDNATNAGDYVTNSSIVGGDCHDAGPSIPSSQAVGRVLSTNGASGTYTIVMFMPSVAGSGGAGTVSSVALSDGSSIPIYSISGSPVITSGTLAFTLANQNSNMVFAGPSSGSAAQPSFRSLITGDLPVFSIGAFSSTPTAKGLTSGATGTINLDPADATHPGGVSLTTQTFTGNKTISGTIAASNLSGTNTGDVSLGVVGGSPNTSAASLSGQVLTLQPADSSNPGVVSTGVQTFAGAKTFTGTVTASNISGTNTGDLTLAAFDSSPNTNGASLSGQVLTLQPASASFPGGVTTGTQTMAGAKTFSTTPIFSALGAGGYLKTSAGGQVVSQSVPISVADGGTGTSTQFTSGSIVYAGASGLYSQANSKLFYDDNNFRVGLGITAPSAVLDIVTTTTQNSLFVHPTRTDARVGGIITVPTSIFTTNGSFSNTAVQSENRVIVTSGVTQSGVQYGAFYSAGRNLNVTGDWGTVATLIGTGITYGHFNNEPTATPATTNIYGLLLTPSRRGIGSITNMYDLYIDEDGSATAIPTNRFSLYNNSNAKSYIKAQIGIGTTSPTANLHVTGTVRMSNFTAGAASFDSSGNVVSGTLSVANGGTGQITSSAAFDALAPTTTSGDTIVFNGSTNARKAVGSNNQVFIADNTVSGGIKWGTVSVAGGGTGQVTATAAFDALAPTTTSGDIIVYNGSTNARKAVGTNGQPLVADNTVSGGVTYKTLPISGGGTNSTSTPTSGALVYGNGTSYALTSTGNAFWDQTNKRLGIGTAVPTAPIDGESATEAIVLRGIASGTNISQSNIRTDMTQTINATGSYSNFGWQLNIQSMITSGSINNGSHIGALIQNLRNFATSSDNGTLGTMIGTAISYGHTNTDATATPLTTVAKGININPTHRTGTITSMYDIFLQADTGGGAVTNRYGIYQENTANNYFGGAVGLGTTSPTAYLHTTGTVRMSNFGAGLATFDSSGNVSSATASVANGGTGQTSASNAFNALSPNTTSGDITLYNGSTNARLAVGSNNQVPVADNTVTGGIAWKTLGVAQLTPATSSISALNIDWSLGNVFQKTITTNSVFTFSNQRAGQTLISSITNTGSFTVTWPAFVSWSNGTVPTQTTGSHSDVITFVSDGVAIRGVSQQNFTP